MNDISDSVYVERITPDKEQYFFGYYDLSPESPDGEKILANRTYFIDHMPDINETLEVGFFDVGSKIFHKITETHAWNYQEGCRLQWIDDKHVIFNDRDDSGLCSKVYDIENKIVKKIYEIPVYSVSKKNNVAVTYGFVNNKYSYAHTAEESKLDQYGDGVYLIDLKTGEYRLILPVSKLAEAAQSQEYHNWVEYCTISPDGNCFFLIHRWDDRGTLKGNQLCVCNLDGEVKILLNSKFISHTGWRGNSEITSWARMPGGVNGLQRNGFLEKTGLFRVIKDLYHVFVKNPAIRQKLTNDAYILFDIENGTKERICNRDFTSDGHCTWSKNGRYMLTDTYPNAAHKRQLIIFDSFKDEVLLLGEYYAIPNGVNDFTWDISSMRCDLHPKWGFDEKHIYFDSVHEGYRGLYRIDVTGFLEL